MRTPTGPTLHRARRSACGGWSAAAVGWSMVAGATHGENSAIALTVTALCAAVGIFYWVWLLIGGRR